VSTLVTVEEIKAAARRLDGVIVRTPLVPFPDTEPRLLIKPESLQPTGSFKLRGAFSAISALSAEQRARGVVAHSSGNHGLAVAYAAQALGVRAVVVVPHNAAEVKVAAAARHGARIVTVEPTLAARIAGTQELIDRHGYTLIPPFDDREVIAGQGTIGLEIAADSPDADLVLVPVSGGGLISGIAAAVCAALPEAKVIGVEPELAADARDSLHRGEREAILLAEALRPDMLLIDDQVGRTIALSRNLPVSGTLGVLERADRMGFLDNFPQVMQRLKASGFFLTDALEQQLLQRHRARRAGR